MRILQRRVFMVRKNKELIRKEEIIIATSFEL
jgi:hypothetical protein